MTAAIGYIRQSRRADLDVALSYDVQLAAIRRLAAAHGDDPAKVTILADMGRSGSGAKTHLRSEYAKLVRLVESGNVRSVYALSMSRLARSIVELNRFFEIAKDQGVRIVFEKDAYDLSTASGKLTTNVLASVYEFERDMASERARGNVAERRARGERMGMKPYGDRPGEDWGQVVEAYREAGSFNGAARILNADGLPSTHGRRWLSNTVRSVVSRHAPEILPARTAAGRSTPRPGFIFYHLLVCSCGSRLVGVLDKNHKTVRYRCHRATTNANHPRPTNVSERVVLAWAKDELTHLQLPSAVELAGDDAKVAGLDAKRERILDMFADGTIDKPERERRLAAVDAERSTLDLSARILEVPPEIDWTAPVAALNDHLAAIFEAINLGPDMRPVDATWTMPELRH